MKQKTQFYAYLISTTGKQGVVSSWSECEKKVTGVPGARYRGFPTKEEAEAWLRAGATYEAKPKQPKPAEMPEGIYFDAGTGRGLGVEISVTNEKGHNLLHTVLKGKDINEFGKHRLGPEYTNNYGELLACYQALRIAIRKKIRFVFGDSKLVLEYWSRGFMKKDLPKETAQMVRKTAELRKQFEERGGKLAHIPGGHNPADLGFHK